MQTALCGKIKERKGKWLIGAKTQNVLYLSIVVTQHKARQRRVIGKARINYGKARRHEGVEGAQFSRLVYS